jgi:hypothetical protein
MSAYKEWVASLKVGDPVRVVQPWNDGKVEGGRTSRGRVTKRWDDLVVVASKKHPKGKIQTEGFRLSGSAGPYAYIVPVDRDLGDDGALVPLGTVHGKRRKREWPNQSIQVHAGYMLEIRDPKHKQIMRGPLELLIRKSGRRLGR